MYFKTWSLNLAHSVRICPVSENAAHSIMYFLFRSGLIALLIYMTFVELNVYAHPKNESSFSEVSLEHKM